MRRYDPLREPDAAEWLEADEAERILAVEAHHRRASVKLPNPRLHAVIHVVVENQATMGDELPVRRILARLMDEGLDRHDAVHAVGSVLSAHMIDVLNAREVDERSNARYAEALEKLTAEGWKNSG